MQSHDPALLLLYVLERWRLVAPSRKQRSGVRWWTPYVGVHVRERRCAAGRCVARHVLLAYTPFYGLLPFRRLVSRILASSFKSSFCTRRL